MAKRVRPIAERILEKERELAKLKATAVTRSAPKGTALEKLARAGRLLRAVEPTEIAPSPEAA